MFVCSVTLKKVGMDVNRKSFSRVASHHEINLESFAVKRNGERCQDSAELTLMLRKGFSFGREKSAGHVLFMLNELLKL